MNKFFENIQSWPYDIENCTSVANIHTNFINKFSNVIKQKIEWCDPEKYSDDCSSDFLRNQLIASLVDDVKKWGDSPINFMSKDVFFAILNWFDKNKANEKYSPVMQNINPFHLNLIRWPNRERIRVEINLEIHFEHTTPITNWVKDVLIKEVLQKCEQDRLSETYKLLKQ
ncbi:MAG: hypothetical protein ACKO7P_12205, partial [Bacteroidota bacterium]